MMRKQSWIRAGLAVIASTVLLNVSDVWAGSVPDLTKGKTTGVNREETWNLGPTGMRGWIHTKPASFLDSAQGRITDASRQILVTDIGINSPAVGVMKVNDVILGVNGTLFGRDARRCFGEAITEAEKAENKGILKLKIWRAGKKLDVKLKLKVMGTYSETAPYGCPKSKRILAAACKVLENEPIQGQFGPITALALMATGNPRYLLKVKAYARSINPGDLEKAFGMFTWPWAYNNIFLCEYYLLTGDQAVLPAIRKYTIHLARRQGMYGTFGHGGSDLTPDGKLHGSIPPYGALNQAGLAANLAIVLGKTCGIKDPEIDPAIQRCAGFFGYYASKGSIPYGEHLPWIVHGSNGKTALAAVLFGVMGGHDKVANTFAKMSTAGYPNRQYGHTGQGFSYVWGVPGANVGGPRAAAAFFKQSAWHLDLTRRCDGAFTYDGSEQHGPGKKQGVDNTYYGNATYYGLSPTATHVLTYALPLRRLLITGKGANKNIWLTEKEVSEAVASGRMDLDRSKMSVEQLVAALSDWSPIARSWIADELSRRPEAKARIAELMAMAEGRDANARQGACETLGNMKATEALPLLVCLLRHDDRWLRVLAADAIRKIGGEARPHLTDMLSVVIDHAEPLSPVNWEDPVQLAQSKLTETVFGHALLGGSAKGVDKKLYYEAIRITSRSPSGKARSSLVHIFRNKLTEQDVAALAPAITDTVKTMAPADTMYGSELRMAGVSILTKYRYKEGIPVLLELTRTIPPHGSENRIPELMTMLRSYGKAASGSIPELRALIAALNLQVAKNEFPAQLNKLRVKAVEETIKYLQETTDTPQLKTIKGLDLSTHNPNSQKEESRERKISIDYSQAPLLLEKTDVLQECPPPLRL